MTDDDEVLHRAARLRTFGEDIPELAKLTGWTFRPYTVHSIGWNYRHEEMPAALARSQLRRLPRYISTAQANAAFLSERLGRIPGLTTPHVPDDRTSVFYLYRLRFDVEAFGLDVPPATFRDLLGRALQAEGVDTMLWHSQPVTSFPIFQTKEGLAPGFPWSLAPEGQRVAYDPAAYPEAQRLLDSSLVIGDARHPLFVQPREVMEGYMAAITKVLADPALLLTVPPAA